MFILRQGLQAWPILRRPSQSPHRRETLYMRHRRLQRVIYAGWATIVPQEEGAPSDVPKAEKYKEGRYPQHHMALEKK